MHAQQTIANPVSLHGVGIHTGRSVTLDLNPAPANSGITFVRTDMKGKRIAAIRRNISSTLRGTTLQDEGVSVATVEHLLAALSMLGIDNLEVALDAEEVPVMDGSALPFAEALLHAGFEGQQYPRRVFRLTEPISIAEGAATIWAFPADVFSLEVLIDFPHIGTQRADAVYGITDFAACFAPARTFALQEEIKALKEQGLALGGSLENALIFGTDGPSAALRFTNEPARHKLLDMLGDLHLLGGMPLAAFTGVKSGHSLNARMTAAFIERSEFVA